jgi:UDP-N-acetylmuramate dehydrogenase
MTDLTSLTTLRSPVSARKVIEIITEDQLFREISAGTFKKPFFILGQGANTLFTKDFPGTIVLNRIKSAPHVKETSKQVKITVGSGFDWHELVMFAVSSGWSGLENLAFIPGTVGAAVSGNIAAYGQNQQDVFESATAVNLDTGVTEIFSLKDCVFTYRDSVFKSKFKNYFLTSVTYRLSKITALELSYHAARHASLLPELQKIAHEPYTVKDVAQAVINLRTVKLPDWKIVRTAGSFFKNPVVAKINADKIKSRIPDLQIYPVDKLQYTDPSESEKYVKLPAGMLLDELGWKGKRIGNVSTSPSHALIVIAHDNATGQEIYEFAENMRADVHSNFDIDLEYEVVII